MNTRFNTEGGRDWLRNYLTQNIATVTFTKADGTTRVMKCTLNPDVIEESEKKTERTRTPNLEVLNVWDVEKGGWRSFRLESIQTVDSNGD